MKKVKSAVFNSYYVRDLNLLVSQEVAEIPDHFLTISKDLRSAIRKNLVICDGMPHKGTIARLEDPPQVFVARIEPATTNQDSVNLRLSALEKSVGMLLQNYKESFPELKYEDYLLYMGSFMSSDYDALVFDAFTDDNKRNAENPGTAENRNCLITNIDNENVFYTFNSKEFEIEKPIESIFPIVRWHGEGIIQVAVKVGETQITVLDTGENQINATQSDLTPGFNSNKIEINISLHSSYNNIFVDSYGVLIRFAKG